MLQEAVGTCDAQFNYAAATCFNFFLFYCSLTLLSISYESDVYEQSTQNQLLLETDPHKETNEELTFVKL